MNLFKSSLFLLIASAAAQECGPAGSFSIAGSSTVFPIAKAWRDGYTAKCPGITITLEDPPGGSSVGAGRVCGVVSRGTAVDIGNMSRDWRTTEATKTGKNYTCLIGDTNRKVVQLDVALDGVSIAFIGGGLVAQCLRPLGGLTVDQLRWIYSNFTVAQLTASGWSPTALANSDGNDATHKWSEIDASCPAAEIKLAAPGLLSGTRDFFREAILTGGATENIATNRPDGIFVSEDDAELVNFVETSSDAVYGDAIVFFGFSYFIAEGAVLYGAPIQNSAGVKAAPNVANIIDGSYNPLGRRIFMNLLNTPASLANTVPYVEFGLDQNGTSLVQLAGLIPIPEPERAGVLALVGGTYIAPTPAPGPESSCGLLGLSIFCPLSFCGFFGSLLGLCNN